MCTLLSCWQVFFILPTSWNTHAGHFEPLSQSNGKGQEGSFLLRMELNGKDEGWSEQWEESQRTSLLTQLTGLGVLGGQQECRVGCERWCTSEPWYTDEQWCTGEKCTGAKNAGTWDQVNIEAKRLNLTSYPSNSWALEQKAVQISI